MKTKHALYVSLAFIAGLVAFAAIFTDTFLDVLRQPALYGHARFVHIVAATVFFANAAVGMLWERRSLLSGKKDVILHTYRTVAWLDARLSSPLIILSLLSGLMLGVMSGGLWEIGWLSWSFALFMFSGAFWVLSDIPTQYKIKNGMASLDPAAPALPDELTRLLRLRWWIGLAGMIPLAAVFALMAYKPDMPALASLFR